MSTKFALPCKSCGRELQVQASQAGTSLKCKCGKSVDVPSMRGIRNLKPVTQSADKRTRRSADTGWGGRQGVMLACLIVGLPAVGYGVYLLVAPPKTPEAVAQELLDPILANVESKGKELPLDETFRWWNEIQTDGINIRGIGVPQKYADAQDAQRIHRFRLWLSLGIGCVALVAAGGLAFLPKRHSAA